MRSRSARAGLGLCLLLLGCSSSAAPPRAAWDEARARAACSTYANIALATYADASRGARALAKAIDAFVAAPSAEALETAQHAWRAARVPYAQTEVFRFYDGPIDAVERFINSWPIDENYVDSEPRGLIEDREHYAELTARVLSDANMREGETSVSTGYHVIEFLLWGRDTNAAGPGQRDSRDFSGTSQLAQRRRSYLQTGAALLVSQLEQVEAAWRGEYARRFRSLPPMAALGLAIKGMGSLTGPELAGERLTVPYLTKDQENEHSCFSDNTLDDLAGDALGVQNVCLGRYQRQDGTVEAGTGVCAALQTLAPASATKLESQVAASLAALRAIPPPFDRAIMGDDGAPARKAVAAAIAALHAQSETLAELASALHVGLAAAKGTP